MLGRLCVCPLIPEPPLATRTRVVLVMHRVETSKSTNTGRIATTCLANSEIIVRGHQGKPSEPLAWSEEVQPLLLFPFEDATPIADAARILDARPVVLIVPDGTWRQASKVRRRVPGLADVTCVSVSGEGEATRIVCAPRLTRMASPRSKQSRVRWRSSRPRTCGGRSRESFDRWWSEHSGPEASSRTPTSAEEFPGGGTPDPRVAVG